MCDAVAGGGWRIIGPMTGLNGLLLIGWSVAIIFEVMRLADVYVDTGRKTDLVKSGHPIRTHPASSTSATTDPSICGVDVGTARIREASAASSGRKSRMYPACITLTLIVVNGCEGG